MCGLVGFSGALSPDILKLKTLGILNQERGLQSCGLLLNNEIYYGTGAESIFSNLMYKKAVPTTFDDNNTVIIHTRKASVGLVTESNAHPFGFLNNPLDTKFAFAGAHNGTLQNWRDLLKENNILDTAFDVDSEALLFIIFSTKNFKVLSKYKGAAALLFSFLEEKNTLYAFRGEAGDNHERPMFYSRHPEGTYFSSIKESLLLIGNHKYEVYELPANTVVKFKDGEIIQTFKIHRDEKLHPNYVQAVNYNRGFNNAHNHVPANNAIQTRLPLNTSNSAHVNGWATNLKSKYDKIMKEFAPYNINNVFSFNNFRYYRNGHLANGSFVITNTYTEESENLIFFNGVIVTKFSYDTLVKRQQENQDITEHILAAHSLYPIPKLIDSATNKNTKTSLGQFWKNGQIFNAHEKLTEICYPLVEYVFKIEYGILSEFEESFTNPFLYGEDNFIKIINETIENLELSILCEQESYQENLFEGSKVEENEFTIKYDAEVNNLFENLKALVSEFKQTILSTNDTENN